MNDVHAHITKYSIYMFRGFLLHHHDYGLLVMLLLLLLLLTHSPFYSLSHSHTHSHSLSLSANVVSANFHFSTEIQWSILIHLFELKMRRKIVFVNAFRIWKLKSSIWMKKIAFLAWKYVAKDIFNGQYKAYLVSLSRLTIPNWIINALDKIKMIRAAVVCVCVCAHPRTFIQHTLS